MNYNESIIREMHRQNEMQANKYTQKGLIYLMLVVTAAWVLTLFRIFVVDITMMSTTFVITIAISIIPLLIGRIIGTGHPAMKYIILISTCVLVNACNAVLSYHVVLTYLIPLIFAAQYRKKSTIWLIFTINSLFMMFSTLLAFEYGMCDLNILFASIGKKSLYINEITGEYQNISFNENPYLVIFLYASLPRIAVMATISKMLQYITTKGEKEAYEIAELKWRSEVDLATKLYNRAKFEELKAKYYPEKISLCVISWGIIDLQNINERHSHSRGDEILQITGNILYNVSNERRKVFRTSGNEFIMVIEDPDGLESEEIITDVNGKLRKSSNESEISFSTAVGYSTGRGRDITMLVDNAYNRMRINMEEQKEK